MRVYVAALCFVSLSAFAVPPAQVDITALDEVLQTMSLSDNQRAECSLSKEGCEGRDCIRSLREILSEEQWQEMRAAIRAKRNR